MCNESYEHLMLFQIYDQWMTFIIYFRDMLHIVLHLILLLFVLQIYHWICGTHVGLTNLMINSLIHYTEMGKIWYIYLFSLCMEMVKVWWIRPSPNTTFSQLLLLSIINLQACSAIMQMVWKILLLNQSSSESYFGTSKLFLTIRISFQFHLHTESPHHRL